MFNNEQTNLLQYAVIVSFVYYILIRQVFFYEDNCFFFNTEVPVLARKTNNFAWPL